MSTSPAPPGVDWERVEQAVSFLSELDIIELATYVIQQAQIHGPKEAFNEAGSVRYQLAKARQHLEFLHQNICKFPLEQQRRQIAALRQANARKRVFATK